MSQSLYEWERSKQGDRVTLTLKVIDGRSVQFLLTGLSVEAEDRLKAAVIKILGL